ncbi:cwfj domain-containing protein [Ophiostoma piceae UAMH 11346]|uniref:Cwfj domain-containing protein n=1 Tax=Ophiostoma piceae (strain UAMH 11346) TaxID=1262450 RepID=S3CIX3_OPHP1|nr:cwfj domain-containing protein [Ophiostoma piceae UAMH 11346]
MTSKLIVLGHVNGKFTAAFKKLAGLHAKNQFAFCIATGNLFNEADDDELDALLAGSIEVPVTTYFTVGTRPFPPRIAKLLEKTADAEDGGNDEVCPNLHYLGKRSVTKTASGLRIVALGGLLVDDSADSGADGVVRAGPTTDACLPFHSVADEASLRGAHGADILLTAIWPRGITRGSSSLATGIKSEDAQKNIETSVPLSDGIADLVAALRPRYHLTASPDLDDGQTFFYEREGFFHPERPDSTHSLAIDVTRFLSLASWGNAAKAKSLYAFALTGELPTMVPAGCTPSPFLGRGKGQKKRKPEGEQQFSRFSQDDRGHRNDRSGRGKRRRNASPPPGPERCFFCLSNPNLPTHMVACIGDDAYIASAKGPLPESTTFAEQGLKDPKTDTSFPGHLIIVPLSHAPTIAAAGVEDPAVATKTYAEMTRFREALQGMVSGVTQRKLGAITWEISRQRNVHVHWQFVPVPAALATGGLVEAAFRVEAANMKLPALEESTIDSVEGDYFRVWIWGETPDTDGQDGKIVGKTLVMRLDEGMRFDLQYGRKVVAKLLGLEATRTVWQECAQTEAEETADVTAFRGAFAPWDFTLEG